MFKGIIAISKNRCIGKDGKLPFHYKEDLQFFKKQTIHQNIIVGRKTFEGLPFLSDRDLWILTRKNTYGWSDTTWTNPKFFSSQNLHIRESIEQLPEDKNYWVAGGLEVYTTFLNRGLINEFYVTHINKEYDGDTFFDFDFESRFKSKTTILITPDLEIVKYVQ